jgi:hypothetical protein
LAVHGRVSSASGAPAAGLTLIAFDKDTAGENLLGKTTTSVDGTYKIQYTDAQFSLTKSEQRRAAVIVRFYDGGKLVFTSKTVRNASRSAAGCALPAARFSGSRHRAGLERRSGANVVVRAFDRDMRKNCSVWRLRSAGITRFLHLSQFARAERGTADLLVRVYPDKAAGTPVAESQLRLNIETEITVDITIPSPVLPEWTQLWNEVLPLLAGQGTGDAALPPWELNDADMSFIVAETGLDADQLRLWVLAAKGMNEQSATMSTLGMSASLPPISVRVPPGVAGATPLLMILLYSWYRDGQPQIPADLLGKSNDDLLDSIGRAIAQSIIQAHDNSVMDAAFGAQYNARRAAAETPATAGRESRRYTRLLPDADRLQR